MLEIKRRLHVDQDYILEKTRKHGEYKYTADDYWTARIDNHKIMLLPLHCQYWYDQRNLTSYCNITWEFYFAKNKNSLAPRWHDKFLPEPYTCWHLWKPYTYAACFALSFVKLFDPCEICFMLSRSRSQTLHIYLCRLLHWKLHKNMPFLHTKILLSFWHDSSYCKKNMGYAKEKEKVSVPRSIGKGKREKKKKDSPYLKIKNRVM